MYKAYLMYFRGACVGANGRVELTRVDDVIVFDNIFVKGRYQEAESNNQIASPILPGRNLFLLQLCSTLKPAIMQDV